MSDVLRIFNEVEINGKILERNFTFEVLKSLNSTFDIAVISLNRDYIDANDIEIKPKDAVKISTAIEKDTSQVVFEGEVISVIQTKTEYRLTARNNLIMEEIIIETLEDVNISDAFKKICDTDFSATDVELKKIILCDRKKKEIDNLVKTLIKLNDKAHYYYYLDDKIVITDSLTGTSYKIDDNIYKLRERSFEIFPIPELKINDSLTYKDVTYKLSNIIYTNKSFICEVLQDE